MIVPVENPESAERARITLLTNPLSLRQQIGVLQRPVRKRPKLTSAIASSGSLCPASGAIGVRPWSWWNPKPLSRALKRNQPTAWLAPGVVSYKGNPAALVTYETQEEKLSPLVPLSKSAMIAGGDELQFGELPLHCHTASGLRVITWRNHGRLSRPLSNLSH